jgi:tryprostatin B 6-hydroxylase
MLPLINQLDDRIQLDIATGIPSEASDLFRQLWFDRMTSLVFSKTFDMLSSETNRHLLRRVQSALSLLRVLTPVPWLIHIAFKIRPRVWVLHDWFSMIAWAENQMRDRLSQVSTHLGSSSYHHSLVFGIHPPVARFLNVTHRAVMAIHGPRTLSV